MPVYGHAGTGLGDATWAANEAVARVGAKGEAKTEAVLNHLAGRYKDIAVLHDIVVPNGRGQRYNIDHAVVAGKNVLLIDSKAWAPGFLWTFAGKTRRGMQSFPAADKGSVKAARQDLGQLLGGGARFLTPLVVVWPTNRRKKMSTWAAKFPGARLVNEHQLTRQVRALARKGPADGSIVAQLLEHVASR